MKEPGFESIIKKNGVVFLIFMAAGFLLYLYTISFPFQFDDFANITDNPNVAVNDLSLGSLKKAVSLEALNSRPVSSLSFAVNYYFSGKSTASYRAVNIIIHAINAYLIYLIILVLSAKVASGEESKTNTTVTAFFTALIWLVSPLNSQAVVYIVQRMTLLVTVFFLLSFLMYIYAREKKSALFFTLCGIFFFLSLMSKQNGIVLPLSIIIYELVIVRRGSLKGITRGEKNSIAVMSVLMLVLLILYSGRIKESLDYGYAMRDFSMGQRLITQPRVLVFYLSLLILPLPGRFSITHDIVPSTSLFYPITTIISILFIGALFIISILRIKKSPFISFALLWFFVTMSVESTFLPLEMAFEHRMYLPCIFLIGVLVKRAVNRYYSKRSGVTLAALFFIVVLFGAFTLARSSVWGDGMTLWSDVIKKYPDDVRAHYNVGYEYYKKSDFKNAMAWYDKALSIDPGYAEAKFAIGDVYELKKDYANAEKYYNAALSDVIPGDDIHLQTLNNLSAVYIKTGRLAEAEKTLGELYELAPESGLVHYNIGQVHMRRKEYKSAAREYNLAIEYGYNTPEAFKEVIKSLIMANDLKGAEQVYRKHKTSIDKLCINNFLLSKLARSKNDVSGAKKYYDLYVQCMKQSIK